ncbi:MAG TPA: type II and III secretion system protein, partial [Fimbriimonas sp.]|nr:type II and III secretion system protein [Fimbriimonas sp.]
ENYFEVVTGPATFAYTTLQTIKTGISLKMTPTIAGNGDITVILNPEVSDVVGQGKGGLPITTSRRASTTVRVRDGETIVIGGMTYANTRKRSNKIPILGDLPIIGQLFRANADEVIKTEVIIMITPHIVK